MDRRVPFSSYLMYVTCIAWLAFDMWVKAWVENHLNYPGGSHFELPMSIPFLVPGYFALTHVKNTGGAWSVLSGHVPVLAMVAGIVAIFILGYERRLARPSWWQGIGLGLLLGGTLGNFIDRVRFGHVTDMFDLQWHGHNWFPIFNIADMGIDIGIGMLLIFSAIAARRRH
ncbi:MAG: signal peptidase II [Cyanobacteria bacterium NC_groundwater_1444_Ag_S-0.65um_54_12]|nr:signal peptidase II [Cyanobacteria bacterium NC_groundwater_1444_Ag_S-0.65um_54_12]